MRSVALKQRGSAPAITLCKMAAVVLSMLGAGLLGYTGLVDVDAPAVEPFVDFGHIALPIVFGYVAGAACIILGVLLLAVVERKA